MPAKNFSYDLILSQSTQVLEAWGMSPALAARTSRLMCESDLLGVDSHGISMLPTYEAKLQAGSLNLSVEPRVSRRFGATALVDGGAGLGHPAAELGMRTAMELAKEHGVGVAVVRNSHHFGAAGVYARLALEEGLMGLVCSSAAHPILVPTGARAPALGTNPIAFAAPGAKGDAFILDMATTTVAANKVKVYDYYGKPLPSGWVSDADGNAVNDAAAAMDWIFRQALGGLSPLGGTAEMSSHKGYGLAMMIQILGGTLAAASFPAVFHGSRKPGQPDNVGHFMLALNPQAFRPLQEFEQDLSGNLNYLRSMDPVHTDAPVMVAGDPEAAKMAQRSREGIPLSQALLRQLKDLCERAGAPFLLN